MQPPWTHRPAPTTDGKAVTALVLGILCLVGTPCWAGAVLGVPAIVFGAFAHRDIRRSDGMSGGTGLATAGIVMGALGSLAFATMVGFMVFAAWKGAKSLPGPSPAVPMLPPTAATTAPTPPPLVPPGGWGRIHVVDVHPSKSQTLRAQLADEARSAKTASETVLVETTAATCPACVEIARAMPEPELQSALAHVRVVHVNVDEFGVEAGSLRLTTPDLPWFYLVDTHGEPRDGISADEWEDNEAEDIAPVLEQFVGGKLTPRKVPWRKGGTTL